MKEGRDASRLRSMTFTAKRFLENEVEPGTQKRSLRSKHVFSRGAFTDHAGRMCLEEGLSRISHARRICLAEVLSKTGHVGRMCVGGGAFKDKSCGKDLLPGPLRGVERHGSPKAALRANPGLPEGSPTKGQPEG